MRQIGLTREIALPLPHPVEHRKRTRRLQLGPIFLGAEMGKPNHHAGALSREIAEMRSLIDGTASDLVITQDLGLAVGRPARRSRADLALDFAND